MQGEPEVAVVRLGHRPGRDERTTTHVGLTARALGADRVVLPANAGEAIEAAREVAARFGGPFAVEAAESPLAFVRGWDGAVVHLTLYGEPVQDVLSAVRERHRQASTLVVVGGGKVPFEAYERADWNVSVTNQPHSEIAALAVFLDRLFEGRELAREWEDAERVVVPQSAGKLVEDAGRDGAGEAGERTGSR